MILTLSLVFRFLGNPELEIKSLFSSSGEGSISQYDPYNQ